jgi:hypothetical protein
MSELRASTAERDRAVDRLRRHAGEGRLEVEELEERLEAALRARTRGELDALFADLPRRRSAPRDSRRRKRSRAVASYLPVMALMVVIWALTGMGYFWPVWPIMGMAIGLMSPGGRYMAIPMRRHRRLSA